MPLVYSAEHLTSISLSHVYVEEENGVKRTIFFAESMKETMFDCPPSDLIYCLHHIRQSIFQILLQSVCHKCMSV